MRPSPNVKQPIAPGPASLMTDRGERALYLRYGCTLYLRYGCTKRCGEPRTVEAAE